MIKATYAKKVTNRRCGRFTPLYCPGELTAARYFRIYPTNATSWNALKGFYKDLFFLWNDHIPAGYTDYFFLLHGRYYICLETLWGKWCLKNMGFLPAILNRYFPDLLTNVHQNWKVIVVKRSPFQWLRQVFEDLFNTSNKFIGRASCLLSRIESSFFAPPYPGRVKIKQAE